jgi:endonuclease/exonuclease/phosphatase family metal-dependent hydrolase
MAPAFDRVRVATWNCFGVPQSFEDFARSRPFWPERLVAPDVVRALAEHDVVCVQENMTDRVRESLEHLRDAAGFSSLWFDPMGPDGPTGTFVGGGLAILARLPMEVAFTRLARGAGPDGFARKGFAVATLRMPSGRALRVVNTHLQADDDSATLEACRAARATQVAELARAVASLREAGSVLVCGDLNIPAGTAEFASVDEAFGGALVEVASRAGLATYDTTANDLAATFHTGGPPRAQLDHLWVPAAGAVVEGVRALLDAPLEGLGPAPAGYTGRAFASDHYALGASIAWSR